MASVSGSVCPRQGPLLLTLLEALNRQKILGPHVVCLPHTSFDVCPPAACWHASSVTTCKNSLCSPQNHPINKSRMFQKKGWMVSVWNIANMWQMWHIMWHIWQMWHMLHEWHTYMTHVTNMTQVTHVTHIRRMWKCDTCDRHVTCIWHIVWHIWQMWLGHFAYFFNICTLSELAVAVELDQLVDLDIDSDHNWWSHVWSKKFTHYQRVLLWSQKISRLHTLDALVPIVQVQTISAGLPVDPLLVDIISLFTKLTIARAGWSRSSSAKTWHWNREHDLDDRGDNEDGVDEDEG